MTKSETSATREGRRRSPRQDRAKATVEAILGAAADLLAKGGLGRLSTNRIAERAGVSIGSVYQYFPDKKELLRALLSHERELARRMTESALRSEQRSPLAEAIPRIVRTVLAHQRSRARYHDALFHQAAHWLGDEQHSTHPSRRSAEALIADFIRKRADEVDVSDPDRAAVFIVQTVTALAHEAIVAPRNESEGEALALELGRMIGRYLGVAVK